MSQRWQIEGLKVYKLNQKEPHQILLISQDFVYLFSYFKDAYKGPQYYYVDLRNWLSLDDSIVIYNKITDQDDHNLAWETNMVEAKKILHETDLWRVSSFQKVNYDNKNNWFSEDYNFLFEQGDKYLAVQNQFEQVVYKSKKFNSLMVLAQNENDTRPRHVMHNFEKNETYLFAPNSGKFSKNDLILQTTKLDAQNRYQFINWSSKETKDLLEITDSSFVVYNFKDNQLGSKNIIYQADSIPYAKDIMDKDINKDGLVDLILNSEEPYILYNSGNAEKGATFYSLGLDGCDPNGISIADANHDGQPDIFINAYYGLVICYNDKGIFKNQQTIENYGGFLFYYLVDLDKDGRNELIFRNSDYTEGLYMSRFVDGSFQAPETFQFSK